VRVLFWGTPEFATPTLRALVGEGFDVVGVVTQPDKAVGRSRSRLQPPPVKEVALAEAIPVLQPERPRGEEFVAELQALAPDVSVVTAYGHILPQEVIDVAPHGALNVHASLLPLLRGAAPIQEAIRLGLPETGISVIRLVKKMDAGPILHSVTTPIDGFETFGELSQRLSELGAMAMVETLALLELGAINEREQDESAATYAPKVTRENTRIDWGLGAEEVSRTIRAYDPRPGSFTTIGELEVKMFGARSIHGDVDADPGRIALVNDEGIVVACGRGAVLISSVQPAGRRRMAPIDWARGRSVAAGDRFDSPR
jgi:methionyl-tRNA formyltransferase